MAARANEEASTLLDPRFLARLERLSLQTRNLQSGHTRGQHATSKLGVGIELAEHRPYCAGDDLRFVDFHAYARTDRLLIKQYRATRDLTLHVLLDCSQSMGHDDARKLGYAKQLAAALGYVALAGLDKLSIQPFSSALGPRLAPIRGRNHALQVLQFLVTLEARGSTNSIDVARSFCARERERGLVVVISDGFDGGLVRALDVLRFARFEPTSIVLRDARDARGPELGTHQLRDVESSATKTLEVNSATLSSYRERLTQHFADLARALRERQIPAFELDVDLPFDAALLALLRRGGLLR